MEMEWINDCQEKQVAKEKPEGKVHDMSCTRTRTATRTPGLRDSELGQRNYRHSVIQSFKHSVAGCQLLPSLRFPLEGILQLVNRCSSCAAAPRRLSAGATSSCQPSASPAASPPLFS